VLVRFAINQYKGGLLYRGIEGRAVPDDEDA
jgi:hypothetical protein